MNGLMAAAQGGPLPISGNLTFQLFPEDQVEDKAA